MLLMAQHRYAEALVYVQKALAIQQSLSQGLSNFLEDTMGQIYTGLEQYDQARVHYTNALNASRQDDRTHILILDNLIGLDSLMGNYEQAFVEQQRLTTLQDSLAAVTQDQAVEELKIQYDTQQKDQQITLLEQQQEVQHLKAGHQRMIKNLFILGCLASILVLGLLFHRYRFKQKALQTMNRQQEELRAQKQHIEEKNHENELLLREIHHRVKNNLQIILSLLNAQIELSPDSETVSAVRESQHRVHAMALIHQNLYQSDQLMYVSAQQYLSEIIRNVGKSYCPPNPSYLTLAVEEVLLSISQAVPLGLIVTELVTNACKHALKQDDSQLWVGLQSEVSQQGAPQYRLTIKDNGPGLSEGFELSQSKSLGLQLVCGLAEQISSMIEVQNKSGTQFDIVFQQEA